MSQDTLNLLLAAHTKEVFSCLGRMTEHKKELIKIVIEDIPNTEKISKLRLAILKFKTMSIPETQYTDIINTSTETPALKDIVMFCDAAESVLEPVKVISDSLTQISQILKNEELSPEEKVEKISTVLL